MTLTSGVHEVQSTRVLCHFKRISSISLWSHMSAPDAVVGCPVSLSPYTIDLFNYASVKEESWKLSPKTLIIAQKSNRSSKQQISTRNIHICCLFSRRKFVVENVEMSYKRFKFRENFVSRYGKITFSPSLTQNVLVQILE